MRKKEKGMKVTVDKAKLIAALQRKQAEDVARFNGENSLYETKQYSARQGYLTNLREYVKQIENGAEPLEEYDLERRLNRGLDWGKEPKGLNPKFASALERLSLIAMDEIQMNESDEYLSLI